MERRHGTGSDVAGPPRAPLRDGAPSRPTSMPPGPWRPEHATCVLASLGDALITTDLGGRITYLNPVAVRLIGWAVSEAGGQSLDAVLSLLAESTRQRVVNPAARCLEEGRAVDLEMGVVLVRRDGTEIPIGASAAPIRNQFGDAMGVVLVVQDDSEKRRVGHRLAYEATHDPLTGLINRREFDRRLERVLADVRTGASELALLVLDLDRFKLVNDSGGHQAGDALLRGVGPVLSRHLRKRDSLARLGGDEFGVLLENCPLVDAERVAESLRRALEQYRFEWEDQVHSIGASIGLVPVVEESGGVAEVLRAADAACYAAKEGGGNRVCVERPRRAWARRPPAIVRRVTRLARAVDEGHFRLYAQPIVPLQPGRVAQPRFEILLRLPDGKGGTQAAATFLPHAERCNLMPAIDRWVVREVIALLGQWRHDQPGVELPVCSINLSRSAVVGNGLLPVLEEQLARYAVPAGKLCFEIDESVALGSLARTERFVAGLRAAGCGVALDNYGSQVGSFTCLRSLPVDCIKIGAPLVQQVAEDAMSGSIVSAVNRIGRSLGIFTVATQVGSQEILHRLHALGLGYAQGRALAPPAPLTGPKGQMLLQSLPPSA